MSELQIFVFSLILIFLILFAAFFSCAETALMAVNRYRLRHQARLRKRYAIRILQLLKRPDRLLGVILIGSTFTNILASSLATLLALHFWGENGALGAAIVLTFIVLIFAEITPKTLAAMYPEKVSRWVVWPIQMFLKVLYPVVWTANAITNGLLRLLRIKTINMPVESLSRDELRSIVYEANNKLSRQYQNMLLSILDLNKLTVDDVMVPRHEIVGIDLEASWEEILQQISILQQDWLPVYRDDVNQIIGVLYMRNAFNLLFHKAGADKEQLEQLIETPYFVPQGTTLHMQLSNFQQITSNIAFVVDEYGDVQGLLTLNDILEEIVGDFNNATAVNKRIVLQSDDSYIVEGSVTIREFNRTTNFELPLRGPRTINGIIIEYLEALPQEGTGMLIADYPVEILEVQRNRVKKARISPKRHDD